MVAYDSRRPFDPARALTSETRETLRAALLTQWSAPEALHPVLSSALSRAATEARGRGIRPEELIIELKTLEEAVADDQPRAAPRTRSRVRDWMVSACVKAYFNADGDGRG